MKTLYLVIFLFTNIAVHTQIVNIPDQNFKNTLVNYPIADIDGDGLYNEYVDTNNDNEIQVSEAEAVLGLNVSSRNIRSLEGIQSFLNLVVLNCKSNQLSNLNITQNLQLTSLYCSYNQLSSLNILQNLNLLRIHCENNQLTSLDVSQNSYLIDLFCNSNQLASLDVGQNLNLERLFCSYNQLTYLDVSQNNSLIELLCYSNDLTNLITGSSSLQILWCEFNQLSILDVSQNINLSNLGCYNNELTNLDLSQNYNLERIFCHNNQLTSLNIKNGNNDNLAAMWAHENPNLECINVDDVYYANSQSCDLANNLGWCKDSTAFYNEECILGMNNYDIIDLYLFPNPIQDTLNIYADGSIENIKIFSIQGSLIKEVSNIPIDVSQLPTGIYFAHITITDGIISTKKFIKK